MSKVTIGSVEFKTEEDFKKFVKCCYKECREDQKNIEKKHSGKSRREIFQEAAQQARGRDLMEQARSEYIAESKETIREKIEAKRLERKARGRDAITVIFNFNCEAVFENEQKLKDFVKACLADPKKAVETKHSCGMTHFAILKKLSKQRKSLIDKIRKEISSQA